MEKAMMVIRLDGSLIGSNSFDPKFILRLRDKLTKYSPKFKFVIICDGGEIAKKQIRTLKIEKVGVEGIHRYEYDLSWLNAMFINQIFKLKLNKRIKHFDELKRILNKEEIIAIGPLYDEIVPSIDYFSARLAKKLHAKLLFISDVTGLFTKDPKKHKDSEFIHRISPDSFIELAKHSHLSLNSEFFMDYHAAEFIKENRVRTVIIGNNLIQLERYIEGEKFGGTIIE